MRCSKIRIGPHASFALARPDFAFVGARYIVPTLRPCRCRAEFIPTRSGAPPALRLRLCPPFVGPERRRRVRRSRLLRPVFCYREVQPARAGNRKNKDCKRRRRATCFAFLNGFSGGKSARVPIPATSFAAPSPSKRAIPPRSTCRCSPAARSASAGSPGRSVRGLSGILRCAGSRLFHVPAARRSSP